MQKLEIYTDGSCLGNPGPGGWGVIILDKKEVTLKGSDSHTTNNRMEMTAILNALAWIQENVKDPQTQNITIYSDSNLLIQTLNQGWKRKANTDLWAEIDKHRAWLSIQWVWVKAHASNKYNNLVDKIALSEAQKAKKSLST